MRKRGIIILGGVALVAVAAATVAVRTAGFAPANVADGSDVRIAAAPSYDLDAAVRHLSEAAQIPTVSNQDPADNQIAEWDRLHAWLASTYPAAHGAMTRTILPNKTLVYYWSGSDASLAPIILMAHQDVVPVTEGTEKDWKYPPFAGTIAEKAVWGRGTVDDKGSLIGLFEAIEALGNHGIRPVPSEANFVLLLFEGKLTGEAAYNGLAERGTITRWLPGQGLPHGVRITIGTAAQMDAIATALRDMVEAAR